MTYPGLGFVKLQELIEQHVLVTYVEAVVPLLLLFS
jgi:hypothetical protein